MVDWKKVFWYKPDNFEDAEKQVFRYQVLFYIVIIALVFIWWGTAQVEQEIDSCWAELEDYRADVVAGFPEESCGMRDGYVVCNIDNFTLPNISG